ncbi:hypothetical protein B0H21DRAFT_746945 [Amylocystis lapponica]|nr:hypothetical protein B0H21DRAFT_746945 [Amylocystis lapponica]
MAAARLASVQRHLQDQSRPRVAIVTGGAQGIGRAIALRLADDGLDVAVADLPAQAALIDGVVAEIHGKGRRALALHADVTIAADVDNLVQRTVTELGGLDVMIANAGAGAITPLLDVTVEELDRMHNVNVKSTLLCYQAAAKVMIAQGRGGRIIGASSIAGKKGFRFWSTYNASKFAVRGLTQSAAAELGRYKITVNAYAPSLIETAMLDDLGASMSAVLHVERDKVIKGILQESAIRRVGKPEDVANLVSFLAAENCGHITGQTISVDGGHNFD